MSFHAVEFAGVAKRYRHFALSEIDLTLDSGQVMGLIGPNGAGKSTTLRILMGLVRPDAGTVRVLGRPMPADEVAIKRDVGFASEDLRLYPRGTLRWHMEFVRSIYPSWDAAYADQLTRRFDLEPRQKLKGMSHGQRVKAALLLLFARRPKLLVLDEPTTGLDPVARHEVLGALMEALADEERTVVFSSHNTADVEQISDRITFVDRGRIVAADDKESFLDRWRRIRLEIPAGATLPSVPGAVRAGGAGRTAVVTTDRFDEATAAAYAQAGATIRAIEPLTLEEIFVASVERRREGAAA